MLTRTASKLFRTVGKFHADEGGNEILQTVLILAVGAMVLIGLNKLWNDTIGKETKDKIVAMFSLDFSKAFGK